MGTIIFITVSTIIIVGFFGFLAFGPMGWFIKTAPKKNRLYFGHPINTYGTPLEKRLISIIRRRFPEYEIVNLGEIRHQRNCEEVRAETNNAMDYFIDLVFGCSMGVFLPFRDGKWGAGVYAEAKILNDNGRGVWEINPNGKLYKIVDFNNIECLSVEETRERIRHPNRELKPY